MENLIEHILTGVATLAALVATWFARKAGRNVARQSLEACVRDAVDYAKAHPAKGITLHET